MANPKKIKVKVESIVPHGSGIYHLVMICETRFPRFKSGQFLHLTIDDFDQSLGYWPESRVFSIAGVSEDRKTVSIVYSIKGTYTRRMEEEIVLGKELWLKAPYGDFIIDNHVDPSDRIILIAGGTGISPFIPYLNSMQGDNDIILNYGLRAIEHMIFLENMVSISINDNMKINLFIEEDCILPDGLIVQNFHKARLSIEKILDSSEKRSKEKFFSQDLPR